MGNGWFSQGISFSFRFFNLEILDEKCCTTNGPYTKVLWSFVDITGFHEIVLYHDVIKGTRRFRILV